MVDITSFLWVDLIIAFKIFTGLSCIDPNLFSLSPTRSGLREHPYKALQDASHRRRRWSAFSVRVVKYWNKLPASVATALFVNISKKRLENVWTEVFFHLPRWLNTHFPNSLPSYHPSNSYHLSMLPNSLFYICGFFRPVVAFLLL